MAQTEREVLFEVLVLPAAPRAPASAPASALPPAQPPRAAEAAADPVIGATTNRTAPQSHEPSPTHATAARISAAVQRCWRRFVFLRRPPCRASQPLRALLLLRIVCRLATVTPTTAAPRISSASLVAVERAASQVARVARSCTTRATSSCKRSSIGKFFEEGGRKQSVSFLSSWPESYRQ